MGALWFLSCRHCSLPFVCLCECTNTSFARVGRVLVNAPTLLSRAFGGGVRAGAAHILLVAGSALHHAPQACASKARSSTGPTYGLAAMARFLNRRSGSLKCAGKASRSNMPHRWLPLDQAFLNDVGFSDAYRMRSSALYKKVLSLRSIDDDTPCFVSGATPMIREDLANCLRAAARTKEAHLQAVQDATKRGVVVASLADSYGTKVCYALEAGRVTDAFFVPLFNHVPFQAIPSETWINVDAELRNLCSVSSTRALLNHSVFKRTYALFQQAFPTAVRGFHDVMRRRDFRTFTLHPLFSAGLVAAFACHRDYDRVLQAPPGQSSATRRPPWNH
jgi:hypothetical protein